MNARKEERRPPPPLLRRAGLSSHLAPKRRTQRLLVSGPAHRALGTSFRGPALCLSVALFVSDNRKFLHGRMEGAITHNEGPVRLVVWELLSMRRWQQGKSARYGRNTKICCHCCLDNN